MQTNEVQRVRIYLSEADKVEGKPRYLAVLEMLREAGATGATALRGVAGFGASQQLRTSQIGNEQRPPATPIFLGRSIVGFGGGQQARTTQTNDEHRLPIIIEWVDRAERIARLLPLLDTVLSTALVTIEPVFIYRAQLHVSGPFGERTVGELASRDVAVLASTALLTEALRLLLNERHHTVVVLDNNQRFVSLFDARLFHRYHLPPPAVLRALNQDQQAALIAPLASVELSTLLETSGLTMAVDASVVQAAKTMLEWGLDQLPVVARGGVFVGLFGIEQALQAAEEAQTSSAGRIQDANPPTPIGLMMQGVPQTVLGYALATAHVERLLAMGEYPLVVVDNHKPLGLLDLATLLHTSAEPLRTQLAAMAQNKPDREALQAVLGETRVASLPLAVLPTLPTTAGYDEAIALLRTSGASWLAAIDDTGKIQGLVGQHTLLRSLVQEST